MALSFLRLRRCSSLSSGTSICLDTMTNVAYLCLWSPSFCCSASYTLPDRSARRLWIIQLALFFKLPFSFLLLLLLPSLWPSFPPTAPLLHPSIHPWLLLLILTSSRPLPPISASEAGWSRPTTTPSASAPASASRPSGARGQQGRCRRARLGARRGCPETRCRGTSPSTSAGRGRARPRCSTRRRGRWFASQVKNKEFPVSLWY